MARTDPYSRKRRPSEPHTMPNPAWYAIQQKIGSQEWVDAFGEWTPTPSPMSELVSPNPAYRYHEGDFFEPGTGNWVLDQKYENPVMPIWGHGLMLLPNRGITVVPPIAPLEAGFHPRLGWQWGTFGPGYFAGAVLPTDGGPQVQVNQNGQLFYVAGYNTEAVPQSYMGPPTQDLASYNPGVDRFEPQNVSPVEYTTWDPQAYSS